MFHRRHWRVKVGGYHSNARFWIRGNYRRRLWLHQFLYGLRCQKNYWMNTKATKCAFKETWKRRLPYYDYFPCELYSCGIYLLLPVSLHTYMQIVCLTLLKIWTSRRLRPHHKVNYVSNYGSMHQSYSYCYRNTTTRSHSHSYIQYMCCFASYSIQWVWIYFHLLEYESTSLRAMDPDGSVCWCGRKWNLHWHLLRRWIQSCDFGDNEHSWCYYIELPSK